MWRLIWLLVERQIELGATVFGFLEDAGAFAESGGDGFVGSGMGHAEVEFDADVEWLFFGDGL